MAHACRVEECEARVNLSLDAIGGPLEAEVVVGIFEVELLHAVGSDFGGIGGDAEGAEAPNP